MNFLKDVRRTIKSYIATKPPLQGDWQDQLTVPSIAEFSGDCVTVRNVRNFRYNPTEDDLHPGYYDKTYDLTHIKRVWFMVEPFNSHKMVAHTLVSFEFSSGDCLAISMEARKTKSQGFSAWNGLFRTYPLIYVAADERDVILLRANVRKDNVYLYSIKLNDPSDTKPLLIDILTTMNELVSTHPRWYHSLFANCTSSIAKHINKITSRRIPLWSWQLWLTASADALALKHGFLDTTMPLRQAREKFRINIMSEFAGDVPGYSTVIRNFKE
jgi:hypothetical protein